MPAAEARIETERASRYLIQVCRHVQAIDSRRGPLSHGLRTRVAGHTQERPAEPPRVESTDAQGLISFGDTAITLRADPGALILRAEAGTEESLQHAQELVAGLLARFGRRDHLSVNWRRAGAAA